MFQRQLTAGLQVAKGGWPPRQRPDSMTPHSERAAQPIDRLRHVVVTFISSAQESIPPQQLLLCCHIATITALVLT
jgi:hypothetical protein